MGTFLLVILVLLVVGALPNWGHGRNWGYYPSSGLGLVMLIVIILLLTGYSQTLAEVGEDDHPLREYIYGQDHGALAQTTGPASDFFHGDHLGTTRQLTDGLGRARLTAGPAGYTPFGEATSGDLGSLTSLAFTGQFREAETALQYHRARWLNTDQGRWLSEDPVWDFPGNFGSPYTVCNTLNALEVVS